jgi:hypothetical protein
LKWIKFIIKYVGGDILEILCWILSIDPRIFDIQNILESESVTFVASKVGGDPTHGEMGRNVP